MAQASRRKMAVLIVPGTEREPLDVEQLLKYRADVLVSHGIRLEQHTVQHLRRCGMPLVLGNRQLEEHGVSYVDYDDEAGPAEAVRIFHEHGHRRIAALLATTSIPEAAERCRAAFAKACAQWGVEAGESDFALIERPSLVNAPPDRAAIERQVLSWLAQPDPPTAFFCWSPPFADVVAAVGAGRGLEVGKGISIITRTTNEDDARYSAFVDHPDLLAAKLLEAAQAVAADPLAVVQETVPFTFVDRGSIAAL